MDAPTDGAGIPRRSSEVPTEKIFDSDRDRAARAVLASPRSRNGASYGTLVGLCSTTFVLGIALTLLFARRPELRRPSEAVHAAPASTAVVEPVPPARAAVVTAPLVVALPPPTIPPAPRRLAKPARAVRSRPVPPARSSSPAAAPWVDPFAE
ncbi:MAG TPA: hypothetical protein VGP07_19195 [Polyangia bacterium]